MKYGIKPKNLGVHNIEFKEMVFYQYLPIKLSGSTDVLVEDRLMFLSELIGDINCQFVAEYGLENFVLNNVYLTVKHLYQKPNKINFNRPGFHSDGFMTDDINYIWSNTQPTVFNFSDFNLTMDDQISMREMEDQALIENDFEYPNNTLLRLNQYSIHKVGECKEAGMRAFVKVSFSLDKYDLIGNSKNYLLDYDWKMKPRSKERNIPQSKIPEKIK